MSSSERVAQRFLQRQAGAHNFGRFVKNPDATDAYAELQREEAYEHGSGGYSGSVAAKRGFIVTRKEPMTLAQARVFGNANDSNNDKWGPSFAVPVADVVPGPKKKMNLTITSTQHGIQSMIEKHVLSLPPPGPGMVWDLYESSIKATPAKMPKLPPFEKEPLSLTYYKVLTRHGTPITDSGYARDPGTAFSSKAEAAKGLMAALAKNPSLGRSWDEPNNKVFFKIVQVKEIVKITPPEAATSDPKWDVTFEIASSKMGPIIGWYFYGMVST